MFGKEKRQSLTGSPEMKSRPQGGHQTATQHMRLRFGEEEQGSGRMTLFHAEHKKASEQSELCSDVVEEGGFEPPKSTTTDLQSAPFGHSGTPPYEIVELVDGFEPPTC